MQFSFLWLARSILKARLQGLLRLTRVRSLCGKFDCLLHALSLISWFEEMSLLVSMTDISMVLSILLGEGIVSLTEHQSAWGSCLSLRSTQVRLSWPPALHTHTARSQETAGAAEHLCNLRTNVETPVRNLTNHLRTWVHGCLSVMSPKHLKAISISCTSFISHSPASSVPC